MKWIAVASLLLLSGCNKATLYPSIGAGLGAGAGSVGGVGGSIAGGMVGSAAGELFKNDEIKRSNFDEEELTEIMSYIQQSEGNQKTWVDKLVSGIYDIIIMIAIGGLVFLLAPFLYTKFKVKKMIDDIFDKDENLERIQRRS
jgi:hypothetical protein